MFYSSNIIYPFCVQKRKDEPFIAESAFVAWVAGVFRSTCVDEGRKALPQSARGKSARGTNRPCGGGGGESPPCDPRSESRLKGEREKRRAKITHEKKKTYQVHIYV